QRPFGAARTLPGRRSPAGRRAGRRSGRRAPPARRRRADPPCDFRRGSTMTTFEALVLGVVQGVTEFLPISSTAHLRIVPALAGWRDAGAAFTAVLQLGTLAAVVGYFLPELLRMLRAAITALTDRSHPPEPAARQLGYIVLGSLPIGIGGLVFKHAIE